MSEKITALRLTGSRDIAKLSAQMKKIFVGLFSSGGVTYSQFLFPYADSLLLSAESEDCFFGSHALLWSVSPERLKQCAHTACGEDMSWLGLEITEIELTAPAIATFLAAADVPESGIETGSYAALLSGNVRTWSLREHSRGFCSFAEHIARMNGYGVYGYCGGRLLIETENSLDEKLLTELYCSKTGGIAEFIMH